MEPFHYDPLDLDNQEIRLIKLLPGNFSDAIRVVIAHIPLSIDDTITPSDDLNALQQTLPNGWQVRKTLEGRLIFSRGRETTWTHPDPIQSAHLQATSALLEPEISQPKYEALSYWWGPPEAQESIIIETEKLQGSLSPHSRIAKWADTPAGSGTTVLPIRSNLASALRHLRQHSTPRLLWGDLRERARHVARMDTVYKHASRVIVWLGQGNDNSALALDTLDEIGLQIEVGHGFTEPSPVCTHPEWTDMLPCDARILCAWQDLLGRGWFQRLWIWQEIILANTGALVQCGSKTVSWYNLRRGLVLLRESNLPNVNMREGLLRHLLLYLLYYTPKTGSTKLGICSLLQATAQSVCGDSRDRIFALTGICDSKLMDQITPSYIKPVSRNFQEFFLLFTHEYRSLDLLQFCSLARRQLDLPTWVPDLTNCTIRPPQAAFACGSSQAQAYFRGPNMLDALGTQYVQIQAVHEVPVRSVHMSLAGTLHLIQTWHSFYLDQNSSERESTCPEAFITAIRYGWVRERRGVGTSAKEFYDDFISLSSLTNPSEAELGERLSLQAFKRDVNDASLLYTTDGHVGMGPLGTHEGDIVSVLLGCAFPMVLRANSNDTYQVIGPAYISGSMDAQAVLGPLELPWKAHFMQDTTTGDFLLRFLNTETSVISAEDPRLGPLPEGWTESEGKHWKNMESGETVDTDPRWSVEELRRRGCDLRPFLLV
ncbi:MAG: hypothetical protein M1820_010374 [Bogoriella megaspora]|nr:MAG: hypothetical protein M1820_010374 [Bogoriella megaspora]